MTVVDREVEKNNSPDAVVTDQRRIAGVHELNQDPEIIEAPDHTESEGPFQIHFRSVRQLQSPFSILLRKNNTLPLYFFEITLIPLPQKDDDDGYRTTEETPR